MTGTFQPLVSNEPIVNDKGRPTEYFIRWAQQRQIDIGEGISADQAEQLIADWAEERTITAGTGLAGGGSLDADISISLDAMLGQLNDVDLSTPPTDGQVIVWDDALQMWVPANQSGGGGGGGGASWESVGIVPITSPVATVDFINLGDYANLQIVVDRVTASTNGFREVLLSTNNGASYYGTNGDYAYLPSNGSSVANAAALSHSAASAGAITVAGIVYGANLPGVRKVPMNMSVNDSRLFLASTDPVNAMRVRNSAGNLTGGAVYLLGQK